MFIPLKSTFFILLFSVISGLAYGIAPQRIVSLANSLTMNLYHLEVQKNIVGCTSFCEIAKKDKKEIVASAIKVNLEKVLSLKPDLVVATTITNPETIESLKKFGIRVEVFPTAKSYTDICAQFSRLGMLVGKEKLASTIISQSNARIEVLKKSIKKTNTPKIFFQIGAKPLYTVIPNTFMNDFISIVGGKNIASDLTKGSISRETVLARNPDIIVIITMGVESDSEKQTWESYKNLNATKNRQIYVIDSNLACTPTPVSFVKTVETLIQLLYQKK